MKTFAATLTTVAFLAGCAGNMPWSHVAGDMPTRTSDGTLIGPNGKTLYTYDKDARNAGTSACYDQCATNWPPLTAPTNAKPMGDYSTIVRSDGTRQWAYQGQPLYYFAKDAKKGDKSGHGVGGSWKTITTP